MPCHTAMLILLVFCFLFGAPAWASSLATISINSYSGFAGLRTCAASCVYNSLAGLYSGGLNSFIGCQYPGYNTCYCNSNIFASASSYVSSCVSSACNEVADVPDAVGAWAGYCSSVGFPLNVAAQTTAAGAGASPSTNAASVPTTNAPTAAVTSGGGNAHSAGSSPTTPVLAPTESGSSGSTSTPIADNSVASNSVNVGVIAGSAVGGAVVLAIAAVIITVLILRHRRQMRREQLLALPVTAQHGMGPPSMPQPPTTDKILKTPTMVHIVSNGGDPGGRDQTWSGGMARTQHGPGMDEAGRRAPEVASPAHGRNPELDGRTWRPGAEMDAARSRNPGPNVFEIQA